MMPVAKTVHRLSKRRLGCNLSFSTAVLGGNLGVGSIMSISNFPECFSAFHNHSKIRRLTQQQQIRILHFNQQFSHPQEHVYSMKSRKYLLGSNGRPQQRRGEQYRQLSASTAAPESSSAPSAPTTTTTATRKITSKEEQEAIDFLLKIGIEDPKIAHGVVSALKESGVSGAALLQMVKSLAGRWEVGEDNGLEPLVEAVRLNVLKNEGRKQITLYVVPANAWKSSEEDAPDFSDIKETPEEHDQMMKRAFPVQALTGLTLTDVAKFGDGEGADFLGESLECACAGIMACSTCHVIIDPEWYDKQIVGEPSESEQDMLDLAYAPRRTSRLGCQIVLDDTMDGMVIRLPNGANNLMDFVPFE